METVTARQKTFIEEVAALARKHNVKIKNPVHDAMYVDGAYEACEAFAAEYIALCKSVVDTYNAEAPPIVIDSVVHLDE
jgi:hypothetical protein